MLAVQFSRGMSPGAFYSYNVCYASLMQSMAIDGGKNIWRKIIDLLKQYLLQNHL